MKRTPVLEMCGTNSCSARAPGRRTKSCSGHPVDGLRERRRSDVTVGERDVPSRLSGLCLPSFSITSVPSMNRQQPSSERRRKT